MKPLVALLVISASAVGCKQPPSPRPPTAIAPAMDTGSPTASKSAAARSLDIKPHKTFEGVGSQWVTGGEPWYSVGPAQKLWRWDEFEPRKVGENVYIRHHFHTTSGPGRLTVDLRQLVEGGSGWAFDETPNKLSLGEGYEASEGMITRDRTTFAVSAHWRPPRGMPRRDGKYDYARPNEPGGPRNFVVVVDAESGKELYRRDGAAGSFAETPRYLGFLAGSTVVLLDRKTWKATETEVPGSVGRLSLTPGYFAVAGGGDIAALFELSDSGEGTEVGRWPIDQGVGVAWIEVHPTEPIVAVSGSKTKQVDVWAPRQSVEKPAFSLAGVSYAHFLADGEHLTAFDRQKNTTRTFTLFR